MSSAIARLIAHKMSVDAIPNGGGLADGLKLLSSTESIAKGWVKAKEWVDQAIAVVKSSPDNPYKTDEEIATEIMRQVDERRADVTKRRAT